jgi:hypothetical protein
MKIISALVIVIIFQHGSPERRVCARDESSGE